MRARGAKAACVLAQEKRVCEHACVLRVLRVLAQHESACVRHRPQREEQQNAGLGAHSTREKVLALVAVVRVVAIA